MKQYAIILILAAALLYAGCTQELATEPKGSPDNTPRDTIYVDVPGDTVFVPGERDTIYVTDTLGQTICGTIRASIKELVFPLSVQEGSYLLVVTVEADRLKPNQSVAVTLNGGLVGTINLLNNNEVFETVLRLPKQATIRVSPNIPPAAGHAISACVTLSKL